jgi:hypothetical protein
VCFACLAQHWITQIAFDLPPSGGA